MSGRRSARSASVTVAITRRKLQRRIGRVSAAVDKMRREGLPEIAVETFAHYERRLREGEQGMLPESDLEPLEDLPDAAELPSGGEAELDRVAVLKLNGGLGTSMGMTKAKSLLEVKDGHSFLDIIVRQVLHLRGRTGARIPLLLMNSFATREDSLAALERYPDLKVDLPLDFVQGKVPKLLADGFEPVEWPDNPALEWAPPGHGDVYTSLATSGVLVELDSDYFKLLRDFEARFAGGPPSLARCDRLSVQGDVSFGRNVVVRGS